MNLSLPIDPPETESDPILWREKLSFFWVNAGNVPVMTTVNSFLLIYYTDVIGLNPAAVGTLFLIARIFDAFNDPLIGFLVDHLPPTRWGRFRPYLILASVLCALNFVLLWVGPQMATSSKLWVAYITYLALGITFPLMDIPLGALLPAMTADNQERNAISGVKGIAFLLIYTIITVTTLPLISRFADPATGWQMTMIVLGVIIFTLTAWGTWGIKERVLPRSGAAGYSFRDLYRLLFRTGPLGIILIVTIIVNLGVGLNSGTAIFYYTYNLGDANYYSLAGIVTLPALMLGVALFYILGDRIEKRALMLLLLACSALGVGLRIFIPYSAVFWVMVSVFIAALGSGGALPLIYSMIADTVDYAEWKHGFRAEGALASIQTFTQKTGLGLGGAIPGFILASTGYIPNGVQTEQALNGILLTTTALPFVFYALAVGCFSFYSIDRALMAEIRASK